MRIIGGSVHGWIAPSHTEYADFLKITHDGRTANYVKKFYDFYNERLLDDVQIVVGVQGVWCFVAMDQDPALMLVIGKEIVRQELQRIEHEKQHGTNAGLRASLNDADSFKRAVQEYLERKRKA